MTVLLAAPVLLAPRQRLFGNEIIGRYHDPFTAIAVFERAARPTLRTQPATDYLGALAERFVGGVVAYNFVVLVSFPLAALFTYLLAYRLTRSAAASTLAAGLYAFSPFHIAHAAYHPHVAQTQWLPLYLLALWLTLARVSARRLALLAVAFALVALSNFYFGFIAVVLTPVAAVAQRYSAREAADQPAWKPTLALAGLFAGAAGAAALYLRRVAPSFLADPASAAFPAQDIELYTARWQSYFLPPVDHPLLGEWARRIWSGLGVHGGLVEQQLTIGLGMLALAAVAVVEAVRRRRWSQPSTPRLDGVPLLLSLAIAALVCSLPPRWELGGIAVPGPSALLFAVAPMFRALARFAVVVDLVVALLAGIGFAALLRRPRGLPRAAACGLLLLALAERSPWPPWRWRDVLPTAAHRRLAEHPSPGRVLDCAPASDLAQSSVPRYFGPRLALLGAGADCGEPELAGKLASRGFDRLIVRRASRVGDWLATRPAPAGLRLVSSYADSALYAVEAQPAAVVVDFGDGFFDREYRPEGSFRWMGDKGTLRLSTTERRRSRVRLAIEIHAFATPRSIAVATADGVRLGEVRAELQPSRMELGELDLAPGVPREIRLVALAPATRADDVLHNGDLRAVSVALWSWTVSPLPAAADDD